MSEGSFLHVRLNQTAMVVVGKQHSSSVTELEFFSFKHLHFRKIPCHSQQSPLHPGDSCRVSLAPNPPPQTERGLPVGRTLSHRTASHASTEISSDVQRHRRFGGWIYYRRESERISMNSSRESNDTETLQSRKTTICCRRRQRNFKHHRLTNKSFTERKLCSLHHFSSCWCGSKEQAVV